MHVEHISSPPTILSLCLLSRGVVVLWQKQLPAVFRCHLDQHCMAEDQHWSLTGHPFLKCWLVE